jgi:rRNA maturation protein Nop10
MDTLKKKFCPVCGYKLDFIPWEHFSPSDEICPSCGIQFGYDDFAGGNMKQRHLIYKEWRKKWIQAGMPWYSQGFLPPEKWDPLQQLSNIT